MRRVTDLSAQHLKSRKTTTFTSTFVRGSVCYLVLGYRVESGSTDRSVTGAVRADLAASPLPCVWPRGHAFARQLVHAANRGICSLADRCVTVFDPDPGSHMHAVVGLLQAARRGPRLRHRPW